MEFDYVIVGGGSAGSVMAARLSEDPGVTVCLLEAGNDGRGILVRAPAGVIAMLPGYGRINNWAYETVPQPGLNGRRGYQPRGKTLGGSSAINAMIYIRGHQRDYDDWVDQGAAGWGWDDVLPYFRKAENNVRGADALHGAEGPLAVSEQQEPRAVTHAFVAAAQSLQHRANPDFNGAEQEGVGLWQVTQFRDPARNGERCSAAAAYVHPNISRPNLKVITGAAAEKIILEQGVARGVQYRRKRQSQTVRARREVILSAGAFGSPQLLQLSGIGRGKDLQRLGIEVVHDAPEVGQNLQDHIDFILAYKTDQADATGLGLGMKGTQIVLRDMLRWRKDGKSLIASPGSEAGAFLKTRADLERPDVQLHFVPSVVDDHARKLHLGYGYSCHVCVLRPKSRGSVNLMTADPHAAPAIDPGFLSHEDDMATLLAGTKLTRRIMEAEPISRFQTKEVYTEGVTSDAELEQHIRDRGDTVYHPVGTVRMGTDSAAPCDPHGRVRGVGGLRVVDASLMPTLIGGNTNAPTIMMAEKIAAEMRA
ncbi:GMC family oxidoreductase [Pontivivens insulae]|uniref:Alcohol dehydrogenase [acceptor] n=1 Tax=Pontivivens insulae TaxID=1639689 RepID=A0A2R8A980_9RHOB|nr:GMC family oxidoreductase N-terminal domain-containing protein [Pontivivens insulae]RED12688.1 choline dehydrogenase-like flavoprotein [Pontivivens insulae]SPF28779.1 Alcohol dehydrogenase [acceptor] [Pontivivens insulae]